MTQAEPLPKQSMPRSMSAVERRVMAAIVIVVLHLGVFGLALLIWGFSADFNAAPQEPMLVAIVALLQAWCGLGALWWASSRWPSHVKTLTSVLVAALAWALLILVLDSTDFASDRSAGWGASFVTHGLVTALGMLLVEVVRRRSAGEHDRRFTILFLLIWMAVVSVLLGGLRGLATAFGWTLAVLQWEFFVQLQGIAVFNAVLAISLWTVLQARRSWLWQAMICGFVALSVMVIANVLMAAIFQDVGATVVDICWIYGGQAAFLLATLGPLQMAMKTDKVTAAGEQTPPPPDSGR